MEQSWQAGVSQDKVAGTSWPSPCASAHWPHRLRYLGLSEQPLLSCWADCLICQDNGRLHSIQLVLQPHNHKSLHLDA